MSAILKAGHMPAGMELFSAGSKSQWDTITKWIDESDVYLLILGGRYGTIESTSQLSYTELEYDYAISIGKPFFAVVAKDSAIETRVKAYGRSVIEQEHPAKLQAFRSKVLDSISAFFEDEKDIKLAIMESLMTLSEVNADAGWVRAKGVPDVSSLNERISRLTEENERLIEQSRSLPAQDQTVSDMSYATIKKLLDGQSVFIPEALEATFSSKTITLFKACTTYLDRLVGGVSKSETFGSTSYSWLYNSVLPKLILHGLAEEHTHSAQTASRKLTASGLAFFSEWRRSLT